MKRNLLCASLLLAGAMTTTLLSSCDDGDDYGWRNNYNNGYNEDYYGEEEEEDDPRLGEAWKMETTQKTPITLMIYGVGGGNLDEEMVNLLYRVNTELLDKMQKQCNVVFQYKFSNSTKLKENIAYFDENTRFADNTEQIVYADDIGGKVFRYKMDNGISTKGQNYTDSLLQVFQPATIIGEADYSMASPDTLANFIKFAAEVAPADNYILMLLNHGGGYVMIEDYTYNKTNERVITRGTLYDDNIKHTEGDYTDNANLTAKALRQAIQKSDVNITAVEFNLNGENALEELCEIADVVDYAVASNYMSYLWQTPLPTSLKMF